MLIYIILVANIPSYNFEYKCNTDHERNQVTKMTILYPEI